MNTEEKLQAVVSQAETDGQKWHTIIHGNNETTVPTENGDVPTVAKQMKDVREAIFSAAENYLNSCASLKEDTLNIKTAVLDLKSQTETVKEQTDKIKENTANLCNSAANYATLAANSAAQAAESLKQINIPAGVIFPFMGNAVPTGFLLCDGAAVSREQYAQLFACIGTTYGVGDSQITFNLPNLNERFLQGGGTAGVIKEAGLPNIVGTFSGLRKAWNEGQASTGAVKLVSTFNAKNGGSSSGDDWGGNWNVDASWSNAIYGASNTVQPPAITARMIIKY